MDRPTKFLNGLRAGCAYLIAAFAGSFVAAAGFNWQSIDLYFSMRSHPPGNWPWSYVFIGTITNFSKAILLAPLVVAAVLTIRRFRTQRPLSDLVLALLAVCGLGIPVILEQADVAARNPSLVNWVSDGLGPFMVGLGLSTIASSILYWLLAGRPKPPHASTSVIPDSAQR